MVAIPWATRSVSRSERRVFCAGERRRARETDRRVTADDIAGLVIAGLLLGYLLFSLVFPERF